MGLDIDVGGVALGHLQHHQTSGHVGILGRDALTQSIGEHGLVGEDIHADAADDALLVQLQQASLGSDLAAGDVDEDQAGLCLLEVIVGEVAHIVEGAVLDAGQVHGVDDDVTVLDGIFLADEVHGAAVGLGQFLLPDIHCLHGQAVGHAQVVGALADLAHAEDGDNTVCVQLHKGVGLVALKGGGVHGVLVQQTGGAVHELDGGLGHGVHAVVPQGGDVGHIGQSLQVVVTGAAGDDALLLTLQPLFRGAGVGLDGQQGRQHLVRVLGQPVLQGVGHDQIAQVGGKFALCLGSLGVFGQMVGLFTQGFKMDHIIILGHNCGTP